MGTDTTKNKMLRAKHLIQSKQYAEARDILTKIDHPTAKHWLARIDEITDPVKRPSRNTRLLKRVGIALGAVAIVVLVLVAIFSGPLREAEDQGRYTANLVIYCVDLSVTMGTDIICSDWGATIEPNPTAQRCWNDAVTYADKADLKPAFAGCMMMNDLIPGQ